MGRHSLKYPILRKPVAVPKGPRWYMEEVRADRTGLAVHRVTLFSLDRRRYSWACVPLYQNPRKTVAGALWRLRRELKL